MFIILLQSNVMSVMLFVQWKIGLKETAKEEERKTPEQFDGHWDNCGLIMRGWRLRESLRVRSSPKKYAVINAISHSSLSDDWERVSLCVRSRCLYFGLWKFVFFKINKAFTIYVLPSKRVKLFIFSPSFRFWLLFYFIFAKELASPITGISWLLDFDIGLITTVAALPRFVLNVTI